MPQIKNSNLPHNKSVHWDENVDLRSPDSKKSTKAKTNFNSDWDLDDGISVVGFRKQIKTSNDKKSDRKVQAKKSKPVKKKTVSIQWQAKPKETTPPKVTGKKIHKLIPASPVPVTVPSVEEEDSDYSLSDDLQKLLNSSPRRKHVNRQILKDVEKLNSLSFSNNSKDLLSARSERTFKRSPRDVKWSFSSNDLRIGLQSRRSITSGDKSSPRGGWKEDYPESWEFELDDPPTFKRETYERDRHTFITSDFPEEDSIVKSSRSQLPFSISVRSSGDAPKYRRSHSLDSIPSPDDLLFNRDAFLFSPDHEKPLKQRKGKEHHVEDTPRSRAYKLTTRSTPVSRAEGKITTDKPNPNCSPSQPSDKPPVKRIIVDVPKGPLTVGESPTEHKKPFARQASKSNESPKKIKPVLPKYGSADLKNPTNILESPKNEESSKPENPNQIPIVSVKEHDRKSPSKSPYPKVQRYRPDSKTPKNTPRPAKASETPKPNIKESNVNKTPSSVTPRAENELLPKTVLSPAKDVKAAAPTVVRTGEHGNNQKESVEQLPFSTQYPTVQLSEPLKSQIASPKKPTDQLKSPENSQRSPKAVPDTKQAIPLTVLKPTPSPPKISSVSPGSSPRTKVKSQTPNKGKEQHATSNDNLKAKNPVLDDVSPWGTPRVAAVHPEVHKKPSPLTHSPQPVIPPGHTDRSFPAIPSLRKLAFNKLRSDFDEKKITPRVIPTSLTSPKSPKVRSNLQEKARSPKKVPQHPEPEPPLVPAYQQQPHPHITHSNLAASPQVPVQGEPRFEDLEQINLHTSPHPEQVILGSFPESTQNQAFIFQGQPTDFPQIVGFPYPDVALTAHPSQVPGPTGHFPDPSFGNQEEPSGPQGLFQRVIILGQSDQGAETLLHGIPPHVLGNYGNYGSQGPVISEIIPGDEVGPSNESSSSSGSTSSVPTENPADNLTSRTEKSSSESDTSPTQFLKNIKRIGHTRRESNHGIDQTSSGESGMEQPEVPVSDRRRKSGAVNQLPSYYKPAGTQYVMRSKSNSRETSAGTSQSSQNVADAHRPQLETIESARNPYDFNPDDIPDFDDSDIEGVYEEKDIYVIYLKTDDGELIGPLRLDIEDIEMGLPGQENANVNVNPDPEEGMRNRHSGSHGLNEFSSRSHSMLTVTIDTESQDQEDENLYITKRGKLTFVDLAGSEKVKDTGSTGGTLTETNNINKSLLILGNCISHLGDSKRRQGHIPYRDSKLTKLLADSLGGNGVTLMIACITPSSNNSMETLNTLRYASRAKKIQTKPVVKMDPREKLILSLKREIKILRNENHYLRQQMDFPAKPKGQLQKENDEKFMTFMKDQQRKESGLYEMLQEYMVENEALRSENTDHHSTRDRNRREQQELSRENERLMKRVEELERIETSPPQPMRQQHSHNPAQVDLQERMSPKLHAYPASGQQYPIQTGQVPQGYHQGYHPAQGHPSQQVQGYLGQGHPSGQGSRLPTRLPPQDLPRPDPNQINQIPNNRTRQPPPPGGNAHPSRPPHRLSDSIVRTPQGQYDSVQTGGPERSQNSPRTKQRQVSPNRGGLDRKVSQGSNSDVIHGMNAKLKSELLELEGEIAQHERYTQRRHDNYKYPQR